MSSMYHDRLNSISRNLFEKLRGLTGVPEMLPLRGFQYASKVPLHILRSLKRFGSDHILAVRCSVLATHCGVCFSEM